MVVIRGLGSVIFRHGFVIFRHGFVVCGLRSASVVCGLRSVVCGLRSVVCGFVIRGLGGVVCGFVIRGLRCMVCGLVIRGLGSVVCGFVIRGLRSVVCRFLVAVVVVMTGVFLVAVMVVMTGVDMMGVDIVMRISIIGDQDTACIVTCELDQVWVDLIERSDDSFTINLNHSFVRVYSGGSELGVDVVSSLDVASSNVEGHTVAALGLLLVGLLVVGGLVTVALMMLASGEVVADRKLGISAGEDMGAGGDHLVGESELLAIKNESILVVLEVNLCVVAFILNTSNKVSSLDVGFLVGSQVIVNVLLVSTNSLILAFGPFTDGADIVGEVVDVGLKGLKSNKHLSLNLDSLLVVVLVPNLVCFVELVDLSVKVSSWQNLTVLLTVIRCLVVASNREVGLCFLMVLTIVLTCLRVERSGVSGGKSCNECDSEFHKFYLYFVNLLTHFAFKYIFNRKVVRKFIKFK